MYLSRITTSHRGLIGIQGRRGNVVGEREWHVLAEDVRISFSEWSMERCRRPEVVLIVGSSGHSQPPRGTKKDGCTV